MMKSKLFVAGAICLFFLLTFAIAFYLNPYYPMLVIGGESSVGTWMSGVLLVISSTFALLIGVERKKFVWILFSCFLVVLAVDERFMIHEWMSRSILLRTNGQQWMGHLPVLAGAAVGGTAVWLMWRHLSLQVRLMFTAAAVLGMASVIIDVTAAGVLWEEFAKLTGELLVACGLAMETQNKT